MQSCKRATELMSLQLDRQLSLSEQAGLRLHLLMCRHCRRCKAQLQLLHRLAARRSGEEPPSS